MPTKTAKQNPTFYVGLMRLAYFVKSYNFRKRGVCRGRVRAHFYGRNAIRIVSLASVRYFVVHSIVQVRIQRYFAHAARSVADKHFYAIEVNRFAVNL